MNPIISIIVPIYKVEAYIENCIRSICYQTFNDYEVILVNDGSPDKSIELAENILKVKKIKYVIINQNNKGVSAARNVGIKNSNGGWIVCVDPDDILHRDFLSILYKSCNKYGNDVSIGNFQYVTEGDLYKNPDRIYSDNLINRQDIIQSFLVREKKIITPAILMRKDFILRNNLFYDENLKFSEDQHLIWRVLLSLDKCGYNETKIYNYFLRGNSTMTGSSVEKILTGYFGFMELTDELRNTGEERLAEKIMARWIFGVLRSSAKMLEYWDYEILLNRMNYKRHLKNLLLFPDIKVKVLTIILLIDIKLFYRINNVKVVNF